MCHDIRQMKGSSGGWGVYSSPQEGRKKRKEGGKGLTAGCRLVSQSDQKNMHVLV